MKYVSYITQKFKSAEKLTQENNTKLRICYLGRTMAQAVSLRPLTAAAWVRAQVNPVRFVVDKVALGQVLLTVLRLSPVSIIPQWAPLSEN
jgi:hypothetical protein